ncbi:MAG: acetyl esterase/lipase [Yoonia sp.]|jgi:acetyl esterase/lipase
MPVAALLKEGFAIASVDYRLSPVARFPANVHDVKAAIRWLRAKAGGYGYDASKVSIAGASAGGHLVAIVGVSNGHPELEGTVGGHLDESSDVQAIVSFYGASNLTTILNQSTPHGLSVRVPALDLLLGGHPDKHPEIARLASPVFHVEKSDPPLLLIHGDQDPQMPINQSHELHGRYLDAGLPVEFEVIHGGRHGGAEFYDENRIALVKKFLDKHLNQP